MRFGVLITAAVATVLFGSLPASAQVNQQQALGCGGKLSGKTLLVSEDSAACDWPFDVSEMAISCNSFGPNSGEVYFNSEKGAFALNGNAKQSYDDPRPIWLDEGEPGMGKIDVGPWIEVGLALC